jgi:hypothetical protein
MLTELFNDEIESSASAPSVRDDEKEVTGPSARLHGIAISSK